MRNESIIKEATMTYNPDIQTAIILTAFCAMGAISYTLAVIIDKIKESK